MYDVMLNPNLKLNKKKSKIQKKIIKIKIK